MSNIDSITSALCFCLLITVNDAKRCTPEEEVRCMVNPCKVSECPGVPQATCQSNYCGGCNAEFYLNGVQLQSVDCQGSTAPSDLHPGPLDKVSFPKDRTPVFGTPPRFQETPPMSPIDLTNKLNSENIPRILKDDTENEGGWGNAPLGRSGSQDRRNRGNRPNLRPNVPPFRARPSSRSLSIHPQHQQPSNSQSIPARRSSSSSSSSRQGQNRRPSWLRNFFRSLFRRYRH